MEKHLRIYFTSDLHGHFYPTAYAGGSESGLGLFQCANRFEKDGNTLVIDGGDVLQGSAFTSYCQREGAGSGPVAAIMNRCGYDFVTVGNHDFNYGAEYLASYLGALQAHCVCQNIALPSGAAPYPFEIRRMENGLRVGIAGIVTDYVNVWERPENLGGLVVGSPFEAAREALVAMRELCDLTVCVYHGGFERDLETGAPLTASTENVAWRICEELDYDILLTGHQHMSIPGRLLAGTFIVQPVENGKEFHLITARVGKNGGKAIHSERITADGVCDPALYTAYLPLEERVQKWLDETVGQIERPLLPESHIQMAARGSGIADLLNRIQLYYSGAEISAVSLANDVAGFSATVTRRDILSTYPFPNTLVILEITGAMLRAAIERSAAYFTLEDGRFRVSDQYLKPKVEHYNYDYFAGVSYTIDTLRPFGSRVTELRREGVSVKDEDTFSICVNNYRASGAGGYPMYPRCQVLREISLDMTELILEYFEIFPRISMAELAEDPHSFVVLPDALTVE